MPDPDPGNATGSAPATGPAPSRSPAASARPSRTGGSLPAALLSAVTWRLAWRDSRGQRRRLALFVAAIVLGVAALVAIESFGRNVADAVDAQAATLLGADLQATSRQPFSPEVLTAFAAADAERANEERMATMIYFPANAGSRLVQLRALDGPFPWYGLLETDPPEAAETFRSTPTALLDESLMIQFDAKVGDAIRLGDADFTIAGALRKVPGDSGFRSLFAPSVYIAHAELARTNLVKPGSRVFRNAYFKFASPEAQAATLERLEAHEDDDRLRLRTIADRKEDLGRSLKNLYRFLGLVGFMALLLGGIGVGSSVHVYMREKIASIAVLRCLGAGANQVLAVYLIQTGVMGLLGALIGAIIGIGIQYLLPSLLGDFLPVQLEVALAPGALISGVAIGVGVTVAFSLLPLLKVRQVPPLMALRADLEPPVLAWRDPARLAVYALILAGITGFALRQSDTVPHGFAATGALIGAVALLVGVARGLMWAVKTWFPRRLPYPWRQGLNNLYRPNNQTVVLMLCLGLGACLIMTLYLAQTSLLQQLARSDKDGRSNIVLFDVQPDQVEGVQGLIREQGLPLIATVPMVTMSLESLKGVPVHELRAAWADDPERREFRWALDREYRSTYRDHTTESETVIAGTMTPRMPDTFNMDTDTVPVSVEADIAKDLGLAIGDTVVWDIQGIPLTTTITSVRDVDWLRMETNFFFVFPAGVLEEAPHTLAVLTRADTPQASADLQRASIQRFSNVSVVDLLLMLDTLDDILDKVAFAIRFMALFSIATGMIVLVGSVSTSRYHLVRESTLLRTLGASRRQIQTIVVVEYLLLGSFAAFAGILLALGAAWGLVTFAFETTFVVPPLPIFLAWAIVTGVTVITGVVNNLDILRRPPLALLRETA